MLNIAIKTGSTYTSIFVSGYGLVLREPTVVAFENANLKRIRAVGTDALQLVGKSPNLTFVNPVREGVINEPDVCARMVREYLNRITEHFVFRPKISAIVAIPIGLSVEEREMYEYVFAEAGISSVTLVPEVILSAIGADMPLTTAGMIALNIGGGHTEAASLSHGTIVKGCGVSIGGETFDQAIADYILGKYNVRVSLETARMAREQVESLQENDISSAVVSGMDIIQNAPSSINLYALDVLEVIKPYFLHICDVVKTIIKTCPAAIAEDVLDNGLFVTGGLGRVPGLNKLLYDELGLPVKTFDRPEYVQILGGGKLLNNKALIKALTDNGVI